MPDATVRRAAAHDAARIAAIYNQSIAARDSTMDTEPVSADWVERLLRTLRSNEAILVLEANAKVCGWGIVKRYSERVGYRVAAETSVYLDRAERGRGFGKQLQIELMAFAREAGLHHLVAKIWADNTVSLLMHERLGFEPVGIQREIGLIDGVRRNVAILQCLLDGSDEAN